MSRPVYVRVRDPKTKHEWDEPKGSPLIESGQVEVVKGDRYPESTTPRPPKIHRDAKGVTRSPEPAGEGSTEKKG